jgi:hypothetical protein
MSARRINSDLFPTAASSSTFPARLHLPAHSVRLRKNGIEFHSHTQITTWTEINLALELPLNPKRFHCNGVVVACDGDPVMGYAVSVVFTALSRHAQAQLNSLVYSGLA